MIINHNGVTYNCIGDPHLSKGFRTGVPLHRRGEREEQVWAEFERQLDVECDISVCMGDLFDSPEAGRKVVARAIDAYRARAAGTRRWIILRGNHDASRQPGVTTSFDLFERGVRDLPGVTVVTEPTVLGEALFIPWIWGADQRRATYPVGPTIAFVHLDLDTYNDQDEHLVPAAVLARQGVETIIGGHYHQARTYRVDDVDIIGTGSMLPYAHGEGDPYITLTLDELEATDPATLVDKMVRVRVPRGAAIPTIDCLALTPDWLEEETVDLAEIASSYELAPALARAFEKHAVPDFVQHFIQEKL